MSHSIICRIGYCMQCAEWHNPHTDQLYLAYGSKSNEYKLNVAQRNGTFGFVPHIYKLAKVIDQVVDVEICCSMYECGVKRERRTDQGFSFWFYTPKGFRKETWPLERWNSLVLLKRNVFTRQYQI